MKDINKVILFEEFCEKGEKLNFILSEDKDSLMISEKTMRKVEETLGVRSFEEFLNKFAPVVYPEYTKDGIHWVEEDNGKKGIKVDLNFKPLKMLINLMDSRKSSGQSNLEFNWQDAFQDILPKSFLEDAKRIRGELQYYTKQIEGLSKESPDYQKLAKKIVGVRKTIVEQYRDNPMNLLPLAMEDCRKKIELNSQTTNKDDVVEERPRIGNWQFDKEGSLIFIENKVEVVSEGQFAIENKSNSSQLTENWIRKDYNSSFTGEKSEFVEALVVRSYGNTEGGALTEVYDIGEEKRKLQEYEAVYKNQLKGYFDGLGKIFQKILGVKAFFDQNPNKEKTMIIVANESLSDSIAKKDVLEKYLKLINEKYTPNTEKMGANIWTAIIPGVKVNNETEVENEEIDLDNLSFNTAEDETVSGETSIGKAKQLLEILSENEIMTFLNFEADENNTFAGLQKFGTKKIQEELERASLKENSYIVPCYPNFTIVDKSYSEVKLYNTSYYLGGIYIDAAYVAAGLVSLYLVPKFLQNKKFNIKSEEILLENPGVRINLEDREVSIKLSTTMSKESNLGLIKSIREEIINYGKGFVFICDEINDNMYTFKCRSTKKEPIYKPLVRDYVRKYLNYKINNNKDKIKELKNDVIRKWEQENKNNVAVLNPIIKGEETITVIPEEMKIMIAFEKDIPEEIELNVASEI